MAKRMLVDATHPEETRVVVVNGNRLDELDFEIASRKQLKGNIYLAKVIRVEPSLQAAFVEYGGNRHGFLAFSEIHPDYYRIPVADREALLREQEEYEAERAARADREAEADESGEGLADEVAEDGGVEERATPAQVDEVGEAGAPALTDGSNGGDTGYDGGYDADYAGRDGDEGNQDDAGAGYGDEGAEGESPLASGEDGQAGGEAEAPAEGEASGGQRPRFEHSNGSGRGRGRDRRHRGERRVPAAAEAGETIKEDVEESEGGEERQRERRRPMRSYKIQEVIKRKQILLVQVTKEERGNKGAALTTFLSLPGRYCVLMPNTPRGGGISRKITNPADRKRLKEMLEDFDIPKGMSVILRTAGIERSKPEVRRDLEYLMRLWDSIRETTLQSVAPALIYEEANLIKRSIRDLYSNDIDEIHVEGEQGFRTAKDFMRMLMPSHAKKIQLYKEESIPLFHRFQVEPAIEAMFNPVVQLKSGGYIVINQTEALVAIDVNSGRSTKERNIEETALKTNLEAADEVARQLRLRDLAGLIVIDFIDMEEGRNNAAVEKRLKEAMKLDRARIQLGRISPFGLLELSRQRLRPSLQEINFERCPHCEGSGLIRSPESAALAVLRAVEEEGVRRRSAEITVTCNTGVTLYILNQKREVLADIERRHGMRVYMQADDHLTGPNHRLERIRARTAEDAFVAPVIAERVFAQTERELELETITDVEEVEVETAEEEAPAQANGNGAGTGDREGRGRRRRRRRRRGDRLDGRPGEQANGDAEGGDSDEDSDEGPEDADQGADQGAEETGAEAEANEGAEGQDGEGPDAFDENGERRKRRRGKRGGRRRGRGRGEGEEGSAEGEEGGETADADSADAPALETGQPLVIEPAPTEPVMAEAAAPAAEVAEAPAEAAPDEAKPKKRPSRAKKKAEPVAEDAPAATPEPQPAPTADVAPVEETKPKKRPSRAKKKPAEAADAATEPTVTEPAPEPAVAEPAASEPAVAEAAAEPAPNPFVVVNPPVEAPKRGWWSKKS